MQWRSLGEQDGERTEVAEISGQGFLVRVCISDGRRWRPVAMTWCPGLSDSDFPAPAPAPAPASAASPDSGTPPADLVTCLRAFTNVQEAVIGAFRAEVGKRSGRLGLLIDTKEVGSFKVQGHGVWVYRINTEAVTFTRERRPIEAPLPTHTHDDAFDPKVAAAYLLADGVKQVAYQGTTYDLNAATLETLATQLASDRVTKVLTTHPRPIYTFCS